MTPKDAWRITLLFKNQTYRETHDYVHIGPIPGVPEKVERPNFNTLRIQNVTYFNCI